MTSPLTVVGSINMDITATTPRLPGPGETVTEGVLVRGPGGKGANQAVAAARLAGAGAGAGAGGSVMIGAVGDDADGVTLTAAMREAGVDVEGVVRTGAATGTALIVVDAAGENQIAVCPGANFELALDPTALSGKAVLAQLEIPMAVISAVSAADTGFFALNAAPAFPLPPEVVAACDLVIVNETEYAALPELSGAKLVAVTHGAAGAVMLRDGVEVASAPGLKADVVSSVGAGDAFCAALVLALQEGLDDAHALRVGCAVGADAVSHASSQPPLHPLAHYVEATR